MKFPGRSSRFTEKHPNSPLPPGANEHRIDGKTKKYSVPLFVDEQKVAEYATKFGECSEGDEVMGIWDDRWP